MNQQKQKVDPGVAYILWAFCFMGVNGLQRLYSGKITSGLVYLCTFGFFGVGQFIDFFLVPRMVKERNIYLLHEATVESLNNAPKVTLVEEEKKIDPMLVLLRAAEKHNNVLSVGQAMLTTEFPIEVVQDLLNQAIKQGLAYVDNDDETGAMRYYFDV